MTLRPPDRRTACRAVLGAVLALATAFAAPAAARAEATTVRFARQLGLGYLQLYVMQDRGLVEKHAREAGLGDVTATYQALGNPSTINEAILSGNADFAAAGVPPFIIAWDKTRGNVDLRGVGTLNSQPAYLNTNRPEITSLKDFTEKDRIVVPSVRAAYQAIILQMASEQAFGPGEHARLDPLTVSLSHPDGTAALLSGKTEITAHFTSPPFQYLQLQDPKIHTVISSYDVLGGPSTFSALWGTAKFRNENPRLFRAVLAALDEAVAFIQEKPREAADIYIRLDNSKLDLDTVEKLIAHPEIIYSTTPQNILKYTDFMARVGTIRNKPERWQDLFFPEIHDRTGS